MMAKKSTTKTGYECQRWEMGKFSFPHNYCRNPDNDPNGPWCFSTNPNENYEYCSIPICKKGSSDGNCLQKTDPLGKKYKGSSSETAEGRPCQRWDTDHKYYKIRSYLKNDRNHNHCRNPDNDDAGPWCYLEDYNKKRDGRINYGHCEIPTCGDVSDGPENPDEPSGPEPECGISCKADDSSCNLNSVLPKHGNNIIGGVNADLGEWPWQVHLRHSNGQGFCAGSIINKDYIVTAAHCIITRNIYAAVGWHKYRGKTADPDMAKYGQDFIKVKKIIKHPKYFVDKDDGGSLHNDIALLKLERSIKFPNSKKTLVRPVCLPTADYDKHVNYAAKHSTIKSATFCHVTGWGDTKGTEKPGSSKLNLMEVDIPVISNPYCAKLFNSRIPDYMLCAKNPSDNADTCQGDSGGPLVCDAQPEDKWGSVANKKQYALMGLTSWGIGCGEATPGVYTKVLEFTDWIKNTVQRNGGESKLQFISNP